jgi:alkylhydroperoxidase family enzyme
MAFIGLIDPEAAKGELAILYAQANRRAGRVYEILKVMSRSPKTLKASMEFYKTVMFGESDLDRGQREMLAVVVSAANHCHY